MGCHSSVQLQLEDVDIDDMDVFRLYNLKTRGRIVKVIDGDTFDILLELNDQLLSEKVKMKRKQFHIVKTKDQFTFFSIFKCRLYGIDAAEKNTEMGERIKIFMTKYFDENAFVDVECIGADKYGRILVSLKAGPDKKDVKEMLLSSDFGVENGVVSYFGGRKTL